MTLNKYLSALLVTTLACQGADYEPSTSNIGTLTQPIYMPNNFGMEKIGGNRCDTSWDGGVCYVPNSRTTKFYVIEASCPGNWWKQRIQNAIIDMNNYVAPYGYSIQQVGINDPFTFSIGCEDSAAAPAAYSWFGNAMDCHDTSRGDLCQTKGGFILIRPNYIVSKGVFIAATEFQQRAYVANAIRHEIGHMALNFGHLPGTQQGTKLMAKGYPDDLQSNVWNTFLGPDADELHAIDCYGPGDSGNPAC